LVVYSSVGKEREASCETLFRARQRVVSAKPSTVMSDDDDVVLLPSQVKSPGGTLRSPGGTPKPKPVVEHPWVKVKANIKPVRNVGSDRKSMLESLMSQPPPAQQPPPGRRGVPLQPSPPPKQQLQHQKHQPELLQPQQQHNRVAVGGRAAAAAAARAAALAACPAVAAFEASADFTDIPLIMRYAGVLAWPGALQR